MFGLNRKFVSLLISFVFVVTYLLTPFSYAYAEEQASETEVDAIQEQTDADDDPDGNEIITEDSTSVSTQDSTLNYTEQEVQGEIVSTGCGVEGSTECDVSIKNDVKSEDNTSEAQSVSGENRATGLEGDSVITSGDSVSRSESENLLNTTIMEATDEAENEFEEEDGSEDGSSVEIENKAEHEQKNKAESVSGANILETNNGDASIEAGLSIAEASQVNIVNTNLIGTEIEFLHESLKGENEEDINLNELWKAQSIKFAEGLLDGINEGELSILTINEAKITIEAISSAISGQNGITDSKGNSTIQTGDSYSSSNIFNLVNMNFIGSNLLLGVINIFGNLSGNIIVPNMDRFNDQKTASHDFESSNLNINQHAYLTSEVEALADSGNNSLLAGGDQELETGDSFAYATNTNYSNINIFSSNWFMMFLNNFGDWSGQVESWDNPGSINEQEKASFNYINDEPSQAEISKDTESSPGRMDITNDIELDATVRAQAISGQNSIDTTGNSVLKTGKSVAFANLFNLVNTNIIGSNVFLPIVNLFGTWTGNLIFAYPVLEVRIVADRENVEAGDTIVYTVSYENTGYEDARNTTLNINVPEGIEFETASADDFFLTGQNLTVKLGTVVAKGKGEFSFTGTVSPQPITKKPSINVLGRIMNTIVKPVSAEEIYEPLTTVANIVTSDSQADQSRNSSSYTVYLLNPTKTGEPENTENEKSEVENPEVENEEDINESPPVLEVNSSNNTGEFVYPGDTVTLFVEISNAGEGEARDVYVEHILYYEDEAIGGNQFKVGTIYPDKSKKLTFALAIPAAAAEGVYRNVFKASVTAGTFNKLVSNESSTDFAVRFKLPAFIPVVEAKEVEETGQVMGESAKTEPCEKENNDLPFILLAIMTLLWIYEMLKRRQINRKLDEIIKRLKIYGG